MLCVLMLRHMPWEYDRYAARLPPLEAMRHLWRLEGVEGVKWREATSKAERLSDGLKGLLDLMLDADDAKRPTLDQVRGALPSDSRLADQILLRSGAVWERSPAAQCQMWCARRSRGALRQTCCGRPARPL
jgi:hypothetical protein